MVASDFSTWHMGHDIAFARGGDDEEYNFIPLCGPCNLKQGTREFHEFDREQRKIADRMFQAKQRTYGMTYSIESLDQFIFDTP